LPPAEVAQSILSAIESGKRELVLAKATEYDIAVLRRKDPEALFDRMSAMVREGYARKLATDNGKA
jgi:dehydrogenase/reductase SDR family member 7B